MQVQPLFFDGRAAEALDFYKQAIGASVNMMMRWKDSPDQSMCTPANADKIMHAHSRSAKPPSWRRTAAIPARRNSTALR